MALVGHKKISKIISARFFLFIRGNCTVNIEALCVFLYFVENFCFMVKRLRKLEL
jgi:hypothetical protein